MLVKLSSGLSIATLLCGFLALEDVAHGFSASVPSDQELRGTASPTSGAVRTASRAPGWSGEIPGLPRQSNLARYYVPNTPVSSFSNSQLGWQHAEARQNPPDYRRRPIGGYGGGPQLGWQRQGSTVVQGGGSRETFSNPYGGYYGRDNSQQVNLYTDGRPLQAELEQWDGPDNTPTKVRVYSEDGRLRPFRTKVDGTSYSGARSAVSVRNTGPYAFPMQAEVFSTPSSAVGRRGHVTATGTRIQGGNSLRTFPVDRSVGSVLVELESEGMPIKAIVELWQGPGSAKQVAEVSVQDGAQRPHSFVIDTPDVGGAGGSTVAIRNVGPVEFPISAKVTPYSRQNYGYGGGRDGYLSPDRRLGYSYEADDYYKYNDYAYSGDRGYYGTGPGASRRLWSTSSSGQRAPFVYGRNGGYGNGYGYNYGYDGRYNSGNGYYRDDFSGNYRSSGSPYYYNENAGTYGYNTGNSRNYEYNDSRMLYGTRRGGSVGRGDYFSVS